MTTIRIQPPMIDVPKGTYCNTELYGDCLKLQYVRAVNTSTDKYYCNGFAPLFRLESVLHFGSTLLVFKHKGCLAACVEAEKKVAK